jgi:class 3 adenylate cyclase
MALPVAFARTSDGVRIAYTEVGDGTPVVFVRGWLTHLELAWREQNFRHFIEALAQRLRVVRFDARGNGLSQRDVGQPVLEDFVADVEAVVDALDLPPFCIWGSSFGGPIAIAYAARHPERVDRLILEGTYPTWVDLRTDEQRESVRSLVRMLRTAPNVASTALSYMTDPEPSTRHEERVQRGLASVDPELQAYLYGLRYDVEPLLADITMPTLVMHARHSQVWPAEGARLLASAIPQARYVELAGTQHNPWEGDSDAAIRSICDFCDVPHARQQKQRHDQVVVMLFTDIVESTDLASRLGDMHANDVRQAHDDIVKEAVAANHGTLIKFTGDGALARFRTASAAITAANMICANTQRHNPGSDESSLRLRIGINAGEPIEQDGDLHGSAVNLAARVCAAAPIGRALVTAAVRDLAAGKGFTFEDRGEVMLKGFAEPQRVFAICDADAAT